MKLLTFLGTGRYQPTTYVWSPGDGEGGEHTTPYAPAATYHFLRPDAVYVFTTQQARQAHFASLCRELGNQARAHPVDIPSGCNEQEVWQIFGAVAGCVEHGDTVALDITHGFRSLPAVGIMVAAFLRTARQVQVERIVYGAWEARDSTAEPSRTPLFDLTPMFSLLEWSIAADRFVRSGDARDMAQLLSAARPPWAELKADARMRALSRRVGAVAGKLHEVSSDLQLIRTHRTLKASYQLGRALARAEDCYAASARPFAEVLTQVRSAFAGLGLDRPECQENLAANLERQRGLMRWYVARQQYVQAVTLAREWVVSWVLVRRGGQGIRDRHARDAAEQALGEMVAAAKEGRKHTEPDLASMSLEVDLQRLWSILGNVRNDVNHAGMRREALPPGTLVRQIEQCVQRIEKLPLPL